MSDEPPLDEVLIFSGTIIFWPIFGVWYAYYMGEILLAGFLTGALASPFMLIPTLGIYQSTKNILAKGAAN